MHRYLVIVANEDDPASGSLIRSVRSALLAAGWTVADVGGSALAAHPGTGSDTMTYSLADSTGVVVGTLFRRGEAAATRVPAQLPAAESAQIVQSSGRRLIERYWGAYAAILRGSRAGTYRVQRDPTGNCPCYLSRWHGVHVFFSCIEDCLQFVPLRLSVNWSYLTACLLADHNLARDCGLGEVENVPGGESVVIAAGTARREVLWDPVRFCEPDSSVEDERSAAHALRTAVQESVDAWASRHDHILLKLSGGLDSSIVAGCLAQAPTQPQVTCLNFYVEGEVSDVPLMIPTLGMAELYRVRKMSVHADERRFARLTAARWNFALLERERRAAGVKLARLQQMPLSARPSKFIYALDTDEMEMKVLSALRATASVNGIAGDAVFNCTVRALGGVDYAYRRPFGSHLAQQIAATARLQGESVWKAFDQVVRHGMLRRPIPAASSVFESQSLLVPDAISAAQERYADDVCLSLVAQVPPGKRDHLRAVMLCVLYYSSVSRAAQRAPSIDPLTAQPVVEVCLRIPTYVLQAGGISRGLARRSFADVLVDEIRQRTVKGVPSTFWRQVIANNVSFVRESLLDGTLAHEGLLDRRRVESALAAADGVPNVGANLLMTYLAVEYWLRQWSNRLGQQTVARDSAASIR